MAKRAEGMGDEQLQELEVPAGAVDRPWSGVEGRGLWRSASESHGGGRGAGDEVASRC